MSDQNDSTNPAEIFQRFGMRVDLGDPDVQKLMQATGIPQAQWERFDRSTLRTTYGKEPEKLSGTGVPEDFRELGVVSIEKHQSGYDVRFLFEFADGDHWAYQMPDFGWHVEARTSYDLKRDVIKKLQDRRVLPFID